MSKLNIDQQTVYQLFSDKKSDFLIPDYQRPFAWGEQECQTLWDDIFGFAFPNDDCDAFKKDDEYFLGPIVTYKSGGKQEIIDGQQRLTTLMLLLRAFYTRFLNMMDKNSISIRNSIAKLRVLADTATDFTESDIVQCHARIIFGFVRLTGYYLAMRNAMSVCFSNVAL